MMERECSSIVLMVWAGFALQAAGAPAVLGVEPDQGPVLVASPEPGWPQWRGPRRDGVSDETGLLPRWPDEGPALLWTASSLGFGYSSPVITGGRLYITGDVGDELRVFALDLEGKLLWTSKNGDAWKGSYPGARASCTFSEGRLYHLNAHGRVACLDAETGRELWAVNVLERFGGENIRWALSENLLVDGGRVFVTAGGARALVAALDKRTGETAWASEPLRFGASAPPDHQRLPDPAGEADGASYASPILLAWPDGRRQLVGCSTRHAFGVDPENGRLLWTRPFPTRFGVIAATPVLAGAGVFFTAPDGGSGTCYHVAPPGSARHVTRRWATELDSCQGGVVAVGGAIYGARYRAKKGWVALDAAGGAVRGQLDDLVMGSSVFADGRLYALAQDGEMALLDPRPGGFEVAGRFRPVADAKKKDVWAHPVIFGGRLYLRYHETLMCYRIGPQG